LTVLLDVLLFIHLLGMATLIGAFYVQWRAGEGAPLSNLWLWGALVQGVTGLAMVGVIDGAKIDGGLGTSGHIKIGVKLVVLVVIALLAVIGRNRPERTRTLGTTMGALTVLNVGIAVFWG
jgi:hypothetical protein